MFDNIDMKWVCICWRGVDESAVAPLRFALASLPLTSHLPCGPLQLTDSHRLILPSFILLHFWTTGFYWAHADRSTLSLIKPGITCHMTDLHIYRQSELSIKRLYTDCVYYYKISAAAYSWSLLIAPCLVQGTQFPPVLIVLPELHCSRNVHLHHPSITKKRAMWRFDWRLDLLEEKGPSHTVQRAKIRANGNEDI